MALATHRSVDARTQAAPAEAEGAVEVITLGRLLELARCDRAALLQMDVEGAENAVFASAPDAVLDRVDRLCLEVHDNRVPHTLDLPRRRLGPAHDVRVVPDEGRHALLFAKHRAVAS